MFSIASIPWEILGKCDQFTNFNKNCRASETNSTSINWGYSSDQSQVPAHNLERVTGSRKFTSV